MDFLKRGGRAGSTPREKRRKNQLGRLSEERRFLEDERLVFVKRGHKERNVSGRIK